MDTKPLLADMTKMIQSETVPVLKKLHVPDHLVCPFTGDLMKDPVTIESGRTYERECIVKYFEVQREVAEKARSVLDDDEANNLKDESYLICPINLSPVDTNVMIENP